MSANNKKIQAQMQIDVTFLSDTTKLVKQLEDSTKNLKLNSDFGKQLGVSLNKSFKEVYSTIEKMTEGLSKKGLSSKQYSSFFTEMNEHLKTSLKFTKELKSNVQAVFDNPENKQGLKDLERYRKELEEINKLSSSLKGAQTRQNTATNKMKEDTGIDYNLSKRMINSISVRRSNNQQLTKNQQDWVTANGLDEAKLKRVLELYRQIVTQTSKINALNTQAKEKTGQGGVTASVEYLEKQIKKLESSTVSSADNKKNLVVNKEVENFIRNIDDAVDNHLPRFNNELHTGEANAKKLAEASNTIREIFAQFGITFSAATVVRGFQDLVRSAFDFYKSLDSALNEIYVVSNLTSDSVDGLKSNFINMAKDTGMALDDVTRSATLFYQQGLNTDEVMEMTEVTSQFAKVAGIDATDAADKLTAAVNGYCLAAEDASLVADKFNKVAAASAADINELSTAFSKAAAQANQAGVGMDNYLAYIATMVEATREAPENIGTSLKTIMSRMQQVKEGGTTEDGETDVNQVETALRSVGVALRDAQGELRNLEDVFAELGPKWQSLDRNTQAYLGTIIAGTRQQSRFITLMQNWDRVLDLADQSANSAGQQALMHAKAMDSIESKVQQFQVAWQEFISNLTDSSLIKGLIGTLTKLLDLFNGANKPITLVAMAVGLLSTKLKGMEVPLAKKGREWAATLKTLVGITKGNFYSDKKDKDGNVILTAQEQKNADLAIVTNKKQEAQKELNALIAEEGALRDMIDNNALVTDEKQKMNEEQIKQKQEQQTEVLEKIKAKKQEINGLTQRQNQIESAGIMSKKDAFSKVSMGLGMGMNVLGMAIGQADENAGGLVSTLGTLTMSIGQMATNPIGGVVGLIAAFVQFGQVVSNWKDNLEAKMTEAVNSVKQAVEKVNNYSTQIRASEDLLESYDKLHKKLYRTAEEQEQLNNVIQQLGDTYNIDTVTDAYGNLSINIQEVNDKLAEQRALREEAAQELDKAEVEGATKATGGWFNNNSLEDYYDKLFSTSKSSYKNLLSGIEDGLTAETREVSENVAKNFSNNLETAIMTEVEKNKYSYIGEGMGNALMRMESEMNEALSPDDWNELYQQIDYLQRNLDDMSFNDVQENLDNFYSNWSGANDLTQQQWDLLVDSINSTVFENESLLEFYAMISDMGSKISGEYYNNQVKNLDTQMADLKKQMNAFEESDALSFAGGATAGGAVGAGIGAFFGGVGAVPGWAIGTAIGAIAGGIGAAVIETEDEKKLEQMEKAVKELKKQKEEYLETLVKEHQATLYSIDDAETWYNAQAATVDMMQQLNTSTQSYLSTIESLYDMENMTAEQAVDYSNVLADVLPQLEGVQGDATKTSTLIGLLEEQMDEDKPELNAKLQEVIDEAFNNLELPSGFTFTQIANELDTISGDLRTINNLVEEFNENGGLTLDSFKDLAKILDSISVDELYAVSDLDNGVNYVNQYIDALKNLDLAFAQNNGMIDMNGEALESLQQIQEIQTKAKIESMRNELIAKRTQVEAEIGYIDAQIAGVDAAIGAVTAAAGANVKASEITDKANKATQTSFQGTIDTLQSNYSTDVQNMNTWTQAVLNDLGTATEAWGRYWKAAAGEDVEGLDDLKGKALEASNNITWEGSKTLNISQYGNTLDANEQAALLTGLQDYRTQLNNLKTKYQATLDIYNTQIGLLDSMAGADLSKLGVDGAGDAKELEKYIGRLKEIYNILNRIQLLEHRLSTLDSYADVAQGEQYGGLLKQRLNYNEQLLDQYEFLVSEQKQFTNGYKDFINSVEGLEGVFDFDKFGQIIINWDKYNALQDEAAEGEITLKEKADDVYDTYTQMFTDLHGYFDELIAYYQKVIELQEEMVDAYIEMQNSAADAIKEIYQKILDTRLEAIDEEKEALEELRKAREDARKDQKNAEDISNLQTNIQRTMMDSSGASDISFIKAQQDMNDKLEEMADDKYSEMLDNIIERLEQEQDALQEHFDDLFSNLDWLFSWLDEDIMGNESALFGLLQQTDEWQQTSDIERRKKLDEWKTKFETYYQSTIENDKGIYGIYDNITNTKNKIGELDQHLQSSISKGSSEIATTIANWQSKVSNTGSGNSSGGGSGSKGTGGGTKLNPSGGSGGSGGTGGSGGGPTGAAAYPYKGGLNAMVGKTVELDKKTKYKTYGTVGGSNPSEYTSPGWYEENVKIVEGPVWSDAVQAWLVKTNGSGAGTRYFVASADAHGQGLIRYFHDRGWGKSGTKYKNGGFVNFTGPAWMDGTAQHPEAVLNALQTEHFIKFTNALDNIYGGSGQTTNTSSVNIENISFNVDSMSSPEDGEKAFNMFVNKFKEIGNQTGIKINSFKNTL